MPLIDLVIPDEAGDVEECVVVTWLKKEGDTITKDEDLLILQAEKVSFEVPAPASGTVKAILAKQGEVVKREQPLARLEVAATETQTPAEPAPADAPTAPPPPPAQDVRASPIAKRLAREHGLDLHQIEGTGRDGRITEKDVEAFLAARQAKVEAAVEAKPAREVRASPVAKRMAREHGLDLAQISGSGSEGRITEKDVQTYLAQQQPAAAAEAEARPAAEKTIPLAGMRAAIAQRMQHSLREMAQLTLHTEADVTALVALREQRKETTALTYTDLIVKACALALADHPRLNATLEGEVIRLLAEVHLGLAVALEDGLVVPVIRHANRLSVAEIARERTRLVNLAQTGQLSKDDMTGSTFTLTNLGNYEIDAFTPIVNPPEAAILGVGRIAEKVVIHRGKIAQRSMLTLSLSFDHRLVDGAPAAAFLQAIKQTLEAPVAAGLDR